MSTEEGGIEESTEPSSSKSQPASTSTPTHYSKSSSQGPVSSESGGGASSRAIQTSQISQQQHPPPPPPKHTRVAQSRPPDQSTSDADATYPSTPEEAARPKQVIAVNASKGPAAFFNLARKFLVADEVCDLSALEGAIVSAADAAHLLERSQLATIIRVQTSYAAVEPKRRRQQQPQSPGSFPGRHHQPHPQQQQQQQSRELRRARIVITVKRTEQYKRWLDENPYQAVLAADGTLLGDGTVEEEEATADVPSTASYVR